MKIVWDKVTRTSQLAAIVLFVLVYAGGFWVGKIYQTEAILGKAVSKVVFACPGGEKVKAEFYARHVHFSTGQIKSAYLPQTISGSGARYANKDESLVFWNKGDSAFIEQNGATVLQNCVVE